MTPKGRMQEVCRVSQRYPDRRGRVEQDRAAVLHMKKAQNTIRMVEPEEFRRFRYPDYPQASTPEQLVRHFKATSPDYYHQIKNDVQKNGFTTPVLVRWNDPRGKPLKRPEVMEGHHRAAVAHELGIRLPVGDYDNQDDYDVSFRAGQDWWRDHERPTDDMPHQARYVPPHQRVFGPTYGLDHRLFHGDVLKPSIVADIVGRFDRFCRAHGYRNWKSWAKIVFFGSEASEWSSPQLEGNGDFDLSLGVHYARFRKANPAYRTLADQQIADLFTRQMHAELNDTQHRFPGVDGAFDQTWFANLKGWNIAEIRPYAAYDVAAGTWIVKPPHLPGWGLDRFPQGPGLTEEIRGVIEMAEGILQMPEPYRTQNGAALWEFIHSNRSNAFGAQGEGWWDSRNLTEKSLDQKGLMQPLWECHQRALQHPESLDAPPDWSNSPAAV